MDVLNKLLNEHTIVINILVIIAPITIICLYIIAFLQGRAISFWPPKIGKKVASIKNLDTDLLFLNQIQQNRTMSNGIIILSLAKSSQ